MGKFPDSGFLDSCDSWGPFLDKLGNSRCATFVLNYSWWFQIFFLIFSPSWGRFPCWRIFFQVGWFNHQAVNFQVVNFSLLQAAIFSASQFLEPFEGSWGGIFGLVHPNGVWVSTPIIRIPDFKGGMTIIPDTYIYINCLTLPHMKYQVPIHHV